MRRPLSSDQTTKHSLVNYLSAESTATRERNVNLKASRCLTFVASLVATDSMREATTTQGMIGMQILC